jgi:hypothetical protein
MSESRNDRPLKRVTATAEIAAIPCLRAPQQPDIYAEIVARGDDFHHLTRVLIT